MIEWEQTERCDEYCREHWRAVVNHDDVERRWHINLCGFYGSSDPTQEEIAKYGLEALAPGWMLTFYRRIPCSDPRTRLRWPVQSEEFGVDLPGTSLEDVKKEAMLRLWHLTRLSG